MLIYIFNFQRTDLVKKLLFLHLDVLKVFLETQSSILFSIVYKDMKEAMQKHSEVDVLVNFASLRSAYDATIETLNYEQV